MAQIRYNPTTGGSTFGDPSKIFDSASRSLNAAIQGAGTAFDKYRAGEVQEKSDLTQDAITSIQGVNTAEGRDKLLADISAAGGAENLFQGTDQNKVQSALRNVDTTVRNEFERQRGQTEVDRVFAAKGALRTAGETAQGKSITELEALRDNAATPAEANLYQSQADAQYGREDAGRNRKLAEVAFKNAEYTQQQNETSRALQTDIQTASSNIEPIVNGSGTAAEYQQTEDLIAKFVAEAKASGNYTSSQLQQMNQTLKSDAGLSASEEISRIYSEMEKDTKTGLASDTDFYAKVKASGNSIADAKSFITQINDITGVTQATADKKYQQRRREKLEDLDAKNYTDAALTTFINTTYDQGGLLALDREDAKVARKAAKKAGMSNQQIFQLLDDANDGTGDFIKSTADDIIATFIEDGAEERAKKELKNSTNAVPSPDPVSVEEPGSIINRVLNQQTKRSTTKDMRRTYINR